MIEKILGKHKSLQRNLIKEFVIVFIALIILSISVFYFSVNNAIEKELRKSVETGESINSIQIVSIVRRSIVISIGTTFIFIVVIMRYSAKKILKPINQINWAMQKVASGNFDVQLETCREDEIGELTKNFNVMVKDLSKIEVLQKDFINNMSHEMKTPISSIKGFAQLLEKIDVTEEERKEYIEIIVEESDRLLNISSNILKLSKLQNKEKLNNKKDVNISEQIKKVVVLLENKRAEKQIEIKYDLPTTVINGDEELLHQVWMNLLDNAIKFTHNHGHINIEIQPKGKNAVVYIKDDGIGMTNTEKRKAFERFYQVDESHGSEGSGLGLAIVKRIITLSGGEIKIESKKGKGTTFIVELPYKESKNENKIKIM